MVLHWRRAAVALVPSGSGTVVADAIQLVRDNTTVADGSGLCVVVLAGDTRMDTFEHLRRYWTEQQGAAEWDEVSGFTM